MLKIGVIGAGHLGKIHIKCLKNIASYQIIGFYDPDIENANKVAADFGITYYSDLDALIDESDVLDIVTPTVHHFEIASKCLRKSKHIFIEKPVTQFVHEAKELIDLRYEANVKVQVGHVERFNPAFIKAMTYGLKPMFIETHRLAEFNPRGTDVSVVLDLMIHDIDITLSVVKSNIKKIHASGVNIVSDTPDIANARLAFDNGCVANLTASRISLKNMRKSRFFQRDAYIAVDFLKRSVEVIRLSEGDFDSDPMAMILDLGENKPKKRIHFENPEIQESNAIQQELESFYEAIVKDTQPLVSLENAAKALEIAYMIQEKIEQQ
jgi:predicted dehydrogenase